MATQTSYKAFSKDNVWNGEKQGPRGLCGLCGMCAVCVTQRSLTWVQLPREQLRLVV